MISTDPRFKALPLGSQFQLLSANACVAVYLHPEDLASLIDELAVSRYVVADQPGDERSNADFVDVSVAGVKLNSSLLIPRGKMLEIYRHDLPKD